MNAGGAVERVFRQESGRVLAALIRGLGDFDRAEEALQEALVLALERWPRDGVPDNPAAWLTTAARNRAIDRLRREAKRDDKEAALVLPAESAPAGDDRLRLIFTCCHPALGLETQVALTLRTLAGLTTAEVAHAFLVPEATMAQRLVRAKRKIRVAGIPYQVPPDHQLPERLGAVLKVVYLVFNEGYNASSGAEVVRADLCAEAVRLARLLVALMPDEPEALGLLGLLLLVDARRPARTGPALVLLPDQDRTRWDTTLIAEGATLVRTALRRGRPGPYQLQAAIAAVHDEAPSHDTTDWAQIAGLYAELARLEPSPVVQLNRAVAVSFVAAAGPAAALALVDAVAADLDRSHLLHSTRADLLRRLGRTAEAAVAYRRAIDLAGTTAERAFLHSRLTAL